MATGCVSINAPAGRRSYGQLILVSSSPKLIEQYSNFVQSVAGANATVTVSPKGKSAKTDARGRSCPTTWQVAITRAVAGAVCRSLYLCGGVAIRRKKHVAVKIVKLEDQKKRNKV